MEGEVSGCLPPGADRVGRSYPVCAFRSVSTWVS
ncbi:MAG: DUF2094 domain-containing protein [Phycisphaerae bacterium]|nr:DUF2094 domain-containing protein [Phycisphaerae bacterium]